MKKLITLLALMAIIQFTNAQMQTIQLNARQQNFDNGRALPAEEPFIVNATVAAFTMLVKMQIANRDFDRRILHENSWLRRENDVSEVAVIPNYYLLRSNDNYNLRLLYYRKMEEADRAQIREMLETSVGAYLKLNIQRKDDRFVMMNSPSAIYNALNTLLADGMVKYEVSLGSATPKFSGIIESMLRTLAGKRMNADMQEAGNSFELLLRQLNNEMVMITNNYEYALYDVVTILNYPTEKKMNTLSLNLGYGGIYESGGFSDLNYFSAPYLGLSLSFGNKVFAGNFWSNTYISTGVFLNSFEASNGNSVSGPVISLPIYAGLGYRTLRFLKIQAGATLLEEENKLTNSKSLYFAPFVGLSIEFNVWLGLGK